MDANALRKQLRRGGWDVAARMLAMEMAQTGLPLLRKQGRHCLRVELTEEMSLRCVLLPGVGADPVVVATEDTTEMTKAAADKEWPAATRKGGKCSSIWLSDDLRTRVDRAAKRTGQSRSAIFNQAISAWLRSRRL